MCGIVGMLHLDGSPVDPLVLGRMMEAQRHRGPDDQGALLYSLARAQTFPFEREPRDLGGPPFEGAVGFNRLSILDLSRNGHQPMGNGDGSLFIVFNGEIYNAFEHRPELEAAGCRFRSHTDTEIILYLYERFGLEGMLERLNGMFAICLVDLRRKSIFLIRDRLGVKPLYWYERDGLFLFSSEVKSFLYHPRFRAELDPEGLDEYFVFRYNAGSGFLLRGVRQLEPGQWMEVSPRGREIRPYWSVPDAPPGESISPAAAEEALDAHLLRSLKLQLLSDVKVGCQLSGGVDSSLVNLYATRHAGADMDAFSIIFEDPRFSEERWVEISAATARVQSHRYTLDNRYALDHLVPTSWHLDQPLNHPNCIGLYFLAQNARKVVTVLLSGEGADELFGGYPRFFEAAQRTRLAPWLPVMGALPHLGRKVSRRFWDGRPPSDRPGWFILQSAFQNRDHLERIRPDSRFEAVVDRRRGFFESGKDGFLSDCLKYELRTYLPDLLVRQDKMTMAHSMENRVPYLDHELVAFVRRLPASFLVDTGWSLRRRSERHTKIILKRLATRYFSEEFVYRPKEGFALPLRDYFTDPRFVGLMEDLLLPGMRDRGVVDARVVEGWWRSLGKTPGESWESILARESIWICLTFELWAQQFLDGRSLPAGVPAPRPTPGAN